MKHRRSFRFRQERKVLSAERGRALARHAMVVYNSGVIISHDPLSAVPPSQPNRKSRGFMVEVAKADPIWFFPHKFWALTRNMPKEQADRLLDEVISLSEVRDLEALRKYDFVSLEKNPYRKKVA